MKNLKFLIMFLVIIFTATACARGMETNGTENGNHIITVEKRVGETHKHQNYKEVENPKEVRKASNILGNANWENAEVSMGSAPNYKFQFESIEKGDYQKNRTYSLWIGNNKKQIELVAKEKGYILMNKRDSEKLFKIVTGEELSELQ